MMKTKLLSYFLSAAVCFALVACNDDNWNFRGASEGSVSFASMTIDVDAGESVVSRADISTDNFLVDILKKNESDVFRSYTYSSMPEVISLAEGDYTVRVRSCEEKDAAWAAPYYVGESETFTVEKGKITEIGKILCKFKSIKVTVQFTKEFLTILGDNSDASVRVTANDNGSLVYTPSTTDAGYFKALDGSSTLVAKFSATIKDNAVTALKTFSDVKAGQHYIITFSVKNGNATVPDEYGSIGGTINGIAIDANIEHETVEGNATIIDDQQQGSVTRPGDEEWPDDPTPTPPDQPGPDQPSDNPITILPSQECQNLNLNGGVNLVDEKNVYKINIHADNTIKDLWVKISSDNQDFVASVGEMLPLEFNLADITDSELATTMSDDLGLPCNDAVRDQNDVVFEISSFLISLLDKFKGTHTFSISVTDANDNTLSKDLILKAE